MDRGRKLEVETAIKQHILSNQLFKSDMNEYLLGLAEECNRQHDTSASWEDTCRIQGRKKAINELLKLIGTT
jgi:hypothetical protein